MKKASAESNESFGDEESLVSDDRTNSHIQGVYGIAGALIGVVGALLAAWLGWYLLLGGETPPPINETAASPLPIEITLTNTSQELLTDVETDAGRLPVSTLEGRTLAAVQGTHVGAEDVRLTAIEFVVEKATRPTLSGPPPELLPLEERLDRDTSGDYAIYVLNPAPGKRYATPLSQEDANQPDSASASTNSGESADLVWHPQTSWPFSI
ncbi:MAG: hypothetical protein AAGF31_05180, partial [Planctomycetota bacterium]